MSGGAPSWRRPGIFCIACVLTMLAQALAGGAGWLILAAGLGFGYIVAATEDTR